MQDSPALTPNPIFEYDLHKLRLDQPKYQRTDRLIIIVSVVVAFMIANVLYIGNPGGSGSFPALALSVMTMLSIVAGVFPFAASLYYMFTTITSVNTEIVSRQWDEIRLTYVSEDELLTAKYAILQLRLHRMLTISRATQLSAAIFSVVVPWYMRFYAGSGLSRGGTGSDSMIAYGLSSVVSLALAYWTPVWSMKAIIAVSLYCAARIRHMTYALLAGLFALALVYIALQVIKLIVSFALFFVIPAGSLLSLDALIGVSVSSAVFVVVYYVFYQCVRTVGLRMAIRSAFPEE